ncbi:MAG: intracellular sulfur oxidation DsrE/DsrF family protein, partial [Rhodothermales bacterium]
GEVEIGGFKPYEAVNPPMTVIQELAPKQAEFMTYLASLFADVQIAETEVVNEGGGIFRITAEVENAGFLPTASAQGVRARSVRPTMVQLGIEPDDLLSGSAKTSFFQATDGSGRRQSFEWIIQGRTGSEIELRVVSQKGGSETVRLRLQ